MKLKPQIKTYATQTLGFDDCRFTDAKLDDKLDIYKDWLSGGGHAGMDYLKKHLKFKEAPGLLLANVKSAIVLIKNYKNTKVPSLTNRLKIARYAVGKDYHIVMHERLLKLADFLKKEISGIECYCGVDSAPIAERSLALESGIGFLGKNSMVIKPGLGSYFFIGVILTTAEFEPDLPFKKDCGKCRLCIDACPTNAIRNDYTLYAKRCISYQTIERKTPLTEDEIKKTQGWLFGCDLCQEVCPYNGGNKPLTDWEEFLPKSGVSFDIFEKSSKIISSATIPRDSALYRSRKRVVANLATAQKVFLLKENN